MKPVKTNERKMLDKHLKVRNRNPMYRNSKFDMQ